MKTEHIQNEIQVISNKMKGHTWYSTYWHLHSTCANNLNFEMELQMCSQDVCLIVSVVLNHIANDSQI